VVVVVGLVVTVVEGGVGTVVLVLDADGHSEKSILQSLVQSRAPPGDGQVKLPKLLPSHCSPGSSTPLPQSGEAVVVVVVGLVVTVVEVVVGTVVLVLDADGHSEKSILQSLVQSRAPPGDGQVKLPKLLPSHCSPGSSTPLPQSGEVVVVVVVGV